jgi:AmmeMemoRadiSam system protein B
MNDDANTTPAPGSPDPSGGASGGGAAVAFDESAPHHTSPKLRPVRPMPLQHDGKQVLGLRDAQMISQQMVVTGLIAQFLLGHMDGNNSIDDIVDKARKQAKENNVPDQAVQQITPEPVKQLVGQLDGAGMLEGPRFEDLLADLRRQFDSSDTLPPSTTADIADALAKQDLGEGFETASDEVKQEAGSRKLAETFDQMIEKALEKADDPSWDALPAVVYTPQQDYQRGWLNYASVYGRMRVCDRPDRIVILGTNNFGRGTGVVGCDKGFGSPLGNCPLDADFLATVKANLGEENAAKLMAEKYDHEREGSIEVQIPWIRHVFGGATSEEGPKVCAFLVHSYLQNQGKAYNENGLDLEPFVEALKAAIENTPGTTLVVCTNELSHVGPAFGDKVQLTQENPQADEFRKQVVHTDQNLLKSYAAGNIDEMLNQIQWSQNGTRWSSLGPMIVARKLAGDREVKLLNYMGASDQQGMTMITTFAGVAH